MDFSVQMFRILCAAVECKSFSGAAKKLRITQPTVSQQMIRLENEIDGKVFERVGRFIVLTPLGERIYKTAKEVIDQTDMLKNHLRNEKTTPSGLVRYAMPESCQWTPHFKKVMSLIKRYPEINLDVQIIPSFQVIERLLRSEIDFGFITGERNSPDIRFEKFADEHYSLVAASEDLFKPLRAKKYSDVRVVGFPGFESFFITTSECYNLLTPLKNFVAQPTVKIGTLSGAIDTVMQGAGIAAIPTHCIAEQIAKKKLVAYSEPIHKEPLQSIYLVRRLKGSMPKRCEVVHDLLKKSKLGLL